MKSNKYQTIQRLITYWEEFEETNSNVTIQDFSQWLTQKTLKETSYNNISINRSIDLDLPVYFKYDQSLDQGNHLLDLISRLARLHEFYIRKFLSNLPINTRLEFVFLYTIDLMGDAKKTEVINVHLVEFTTGMDIIKRLLNQRLIKESLNESDKRSKLIHTTEKGKAVLSRSMLQMNAEKEMFLACINANKWKKTMSTLEELNSFHNNIYLKHNSKNDAELINLVASLKYLNRTSY
jgi:DNA-binding MarR family transcriptional regulator